MTARPPASLLDRRAPYRGDQRRAALLNALGELLHDSPLDAINVAEISRRAGVTRSAFYFYFENKAAAVASLTEEMYERSVAAAGHLRDASRPACERIERMIDAVLGSWQEQAHLYRALLDARHSNPAVREMWDADRASFVEPIAQLIDAERAAGHAPPGPPATALATVLLELNDRAQEQMATGDPLSCTDRADALATIWLRTIYGRTP